MPRRRGRSVRACAKCTSRICPAAFSRAERTPLAGRRRASTEPPRTCGDLAIPGALRAAAWPPFAVPLFAEPIALLHQPLIAARGIAAQHLTVELQAPQAFFHFRNFARRLR